MRLRNLNGIVKVVTIDDVITTEYFTRLGKRSVGRKSLVVASLYRRCSRRAVKRVMAILSDRRSSP